MDPVDAGCLLVMRDVYWSYMTTDLLPKHYIRIPEAAHISGWSETTVYRHLPFVKTYKVKRPGTKNAALLIDYADFIAYIGRFAKGPTAAPTPARHAEGESLSL